MDTERAVTVQLWGEGSKVTVEFTGAPCACEDFQMLITAFARQWVRERQERIAEGQIVPCPCMEKA